MATPVIIVHYHLDPGGVTQVIETQVEALQAAEIPYLILTGKAYTGSSGIRQHILPGLNYKLTANDLQKEVDELFSQCIEAVSTQFGTQEVIWHIHNPTLGKNILWSGLIELLSLSTEKILLHCHDLAEDGRPSNYNLTADREQIFPIAPNIHYAFVNSRDLERLQKAGIPVKQLHLLPNAIAKPKYQHAVDFNKDPLIVYPVRGIRRKNVGEFLLWSALAPRGSKFVLTLEPDNPEWRMIYTMWKQLAQDLKLPATLGCIGKENAPGADGSSFQDWMRAATHCITTSVAEGFGLTFLDPLSMQIPLIGRDLPEITKDFDLPDSAKTNLYEKILIPVDAFDQENLREDLKNALTQTFSAYQAPTSEEEINTAWDAIIKDGFVDFANLPERLQISFLIRAEVDSFREFKVLKTDGEIVDATEWIANVLEPNFSSPLSAPELLTDYHQDRYQERLLTILQEVDNSEKYAPRWLPKNQVLEQYLSPERFHFLRC